jgi:hypothetical protein
MEEKRNRAVSILVSCIVLLSASVGQAAHQVKITTADQGNGGVAVTAEGKNDIICCDPRYPHDCWSTGKVWVWTTTVNLNNSYTSCSEYNPIEPPGKGFASCTKIIDRYFLHGTHTFEALSYDCNYNTVSTTATMTFDNTPSVSVSGPSGVVSAPFDVTGTATFKPALNAMKGDITAYINGGGIASKQCFTENCTFSYQELTGKLYDMNHGGPYPVRFYARRHGAPPAEATGSFSVDKTPEVSVTGPSGVVSEPFDVTGTATFKPTTSAIKGTITAYINNGEIGRKNCTTESCTYSYREAAGKLYDMNHGGPYSIKMIATGGGATAEATGSFSVDKTPEVALTAPPGGNVQTPFDIAGTATFKPTTSATKGSITAYINNGRIATKQCTTESCTFSYLYSASVGSSVIVRLTATATGGGASASDEREVFVEALNPGQGCPVPQPGTCPAPCQP